MMIRQSLLCLPGKATALHTECRFESLGAFLLLERQMFILEGSSVEVTPDQVTGEDFSHLAASGS